MSDRPEHRAGGRILSSVPTFRVKDVAATARWYSDRLGFETMGTVPKQPPYSYASLQRDRAEIMLLQLVEKTRPGWADRPGDGPWDAYFRMRGVAALYERLKHEPFVVMPLTRQPYGDWEFAVRDPNGYLLVFGGDSDIAVR